MWCEYIERQFIFRRCLESLTFSPHEISPPLLWHDSGDACFHDKLGEAMKDGSWCDEWKRQEVKTSKARGRHIGR